MLQTRAKELGLPITANMIGRTIEVCEGERDGDFLTLRRIEGHPNAPAVKREAEEDWS